MAEYRSKYTGAEVDALLDKVENGEVGGKVTVDSVLSTESENPVQNKVITAELSDLSSKVDEEVESLQTQLDSHDILIEDLQENKADVSGYYPQLSVGQADNLPDRGDVTEGLIGFRESAGAGNSIEDGTANVVELLGNSVVWNQLCIRGTVRNGTSNGISYSVNANGVFSLNGQTSDNYAFTLSEYVVNYIAGHKYILLGKETDVVKLQIFLQQGNATTSILGNGIFTCNNTMTASGMPRYRVERNSSVENFEGIPSLIDLTQMFGAGNEPTTIEEFYARKPMGIEDENAYNEGEVIGVNIKGIKSVNDNAFNGKYAKVLGGREYCADGTITSIGFAKEMGGTTEAIVLDSENKFTPTENGYVYASGTDICIHLVHTGYKDHVYTEHEVSESSFDLTPYFPNGMHGINDMRDSVTKSKAVRRFEKVKMKDLSWAYRTADESYPYGFLHCRIEDKLNGVSNLLSSRYSLGCDFNEDKIIFGNTRGVNIYVVDASYTDAAPFVASLTDDDIIIYELATPIETEIDPQLNMNYKVWDFGTEELLTDSKSAPVLARTIYGFNATDTIRGNKEKIKNNEERIRELESEAVRGDDYQPNLSVGLADNLAGVDVVDSEVNFRRSGGGAISDGVARIESIKGNSVVWNQLSGHGATSLSQESWKGNRVTINGTFEEETSIFDTESRGAELSFPNVGNKCLVIIRKISGKVLSGEVKTFAVSIVSGTNIAFSADSTESYKVIFSTFKEGSTYHFYRRYLAGTVCENLVLEYQFIDLTKMFGAGNEPTTIEDFYARIPMGVDLNAYNEGEVIHMDVQSIESQGVNAWDEEWESGHISKGQPIADSTRIRSKNFIKILPNTSYHSTQRVSFVFYDVEYQYISLDYSQDTTTPSNAMYMKFSYGGSTNPITTYNHDICINISDTSINGKYFPYIKRVEDLSIIRNYFPNGMKSAGSAHDEIRYNKATQKWEYSKGKIKSVDLGTLDWAQDESDATRFRTIATTWKATYTNNLLCEKYATAPTQDLSLPDKSIAMTNSQTIPLFRVKDSAYTDVESFKAAMQGVIVYYESTDWEWVELDAEDQFKDLDYQVWNCGTEKAIAEGKSAPLAADITYGFNAIGKIKELESLVAQLRAKVGI